MIFKLIKLFIHILDKLSKPLTAKVLNTLFFQPKRFPHPEKEKPFLNRAERFSFVHNEIDVQCYKWGKPSTKRVLLIHGWEGRATQLSQFIEPLNERGYEVFSYDGIAHGFTKGKETNMPEMAQLIEHMINEYTIDHIIAHSFGGMATTFAVKQNRIKPKSISLVGSPYDIDYILESYLDIFELSYSYSNAIIGHVEKKINIPYTDVMFDTYPETTDIPLLLIHDKKDKEVAFSEMEKFLPKWKHVDTMITESLGHRRILKNKDVMNRIFTFLEAHTSEVATKGA